MSLNPAKLSSIVSSLFPDAVVAAELRDSGDASLLLPEERRSLGRALPKRVKEFAAGRLCARRALAEFGLHDFPVCVARDRQPLWPQNLVGSITHTEGFCAAVVAERRRVLAIGIDCERVNHVNSEVRDLVCVPTESIWLASLRPNERTRVGALLFAAKEAFYKCQYPLVGQWMDFHDLHVSPLEIVANQGEFTVKATRSIKVFNHAIRGRYRFDEGLVSAGICLPAPAKGVSSQFADDLVYP